MSAMKTPALNKPFAMIREFQLADWFTLANAVCGTGALFSMLTYLQTSDGSHVYFVHSFHVVPDNKEVISTTTEYGIEFVSSIWKDNIFAVQFHPEKSQTLGLAILKRFGEQKA